MAARRNRIIDNLRNGSARNGHNGAAGPAKTAAPAVEPGDLGTLLSNVKPSRVRWLWPGRIPYGKLTILDGDPGLGKSVLTIDLAARVTRGERMPFAEGDAGDDPEPAGVIMLNAEDGDDDTIRPRLDAAGGDPERVLLFDAIPEGDHKRLPVLPADLALLGLACRRMRARLVVIDPLNAFLGPETNAHRDQDVRRALHPMAHVAAQTGAAILVVRHLNKSGGSNALYRGGGSIGIVGAARSALLVARDPDDPDRRVIASIKCNLARQPGSLSFDLSAADNGALRVGWIGPSEHTAATLLAPANDDEASGALEEAITFLSELLAAGPVAAAEIVKQSKRAAISEATLRRAKRRLRIDTRRTGFGGAGAYSWFLPGQAP